MFQQRPLSAQWVEALRGYTIICPPSNNTIRITVYKTTASVVGTPTRHPTRVLVPDPSLLVGDPQQALYKLTVSRDRTTPEAPPATTVSTAPTPATFQPSPEAPTGLLDRALDLSQAHIPLGQAVHLLTPPADLHRGTSSGGITLYPASSGPDQDVTIPSQDRMAAIRTRAKEAAERAVRDLLRKRSADAAIADHTYDKKDVAAAEGAPLPRPPPPPVQSGEGAQP